MQLGRHNFEKEADRRIHLGWAVFSKLKQKLLVGYITEPEDESLQPIHPMTYGVETWTLITYTYNFIRRKNWDERKL